MIIHVSESWGGGVQTSVESFINATSEFEHVLVVKKRKFDVGISLNVRTFYCSNVFEIFHHLRKLTSNNPDSVIHFHSTFAGLLRIFFFRNRKVYTAHCYSFEMFNGMNFRKIFYYAIEFILSYFTDIYYAISPREFHIASRMKYAKIIKGCNYVSHITGKRKRSRLDSFTIGMMGRVERQKNPKLFAKFAVKFREIHSNSNINFVWIGTGDSDICSLLERSGVKVTGWMNREDALIKLSSVDLLVHTALWEGSPLTTLEALNFDIPVIAYGHPSMVSLGYSYFTDLESLIRKTSSLYLNRDRYLDTVQVGKNILCKNSLKACRHSLMSAYN